MALKHSETLGNRLKCIKNEYFNKKKTPLIELKHQRDFPILFGLHLNTIQ